MIAFVDVPPDSRFLPQAAELNDGLVVTFFSPLIGKLERDGGTLPDAYPQSTVTEASKRQRDAYRDRFAEHWNADKAVEVVEDDTNHMSHLHCTALRDDAEDHQHTRTAVLAPLSAGQHCRSGRTGTAVLSH